jgi:hypothetical protein
VAVLRPNLRGTAAAPSTEPAVNAPMVAPAAFFDLREE